MAENTGNVLHKPIMSSDFDCFSVSVYSDFQLIYDDMQSVLHDYNDPISTNTKV